MQLLLYNVYCLIQSKTNSMKVADHLSNSQKSRICMIIYGIIIVFLLFLVHETFSYNIIQRHSAIYVTGVLAVISFVYAIVAHLHKPHFKLFILLNTQLQQNIPDAKQTVKENSQHFIAMLREMSEHQLKQIPFLISELEQYNETCIV